MHNWNMIYNFFLLFFGLMRYLVSHTLLCILLSMEDLTEIFAVEICCSVLAAMKQVLPSKAADNCDLLAAVLSVCGDVYIGLAHCVETDLQTHCRELTDWPQQTADIVDFIADESVASGNFCCYNFTFTLLNMFEIARFNER